jgi:outer membrane protein assembly factor BamB
MQNSKLLRLVFFLTFSVIAHFDLVAQEPESMLTQYGHQTNWQNQPAFDLANGISESWRRTVGEGRSQIVGDEHQIFVAAGGSKKVNGTNRLETSFSRLNPETGEIVWQRKFTSEMDEEQETFSGAQASPQSTPALTKEFVIAISFTGRLVCLRRENGETVWEKDLVSEFGSKPVQYGFAASPAIADSVRDQVCVMAAGELGGLLCLCVSDGSVVWKADCTSFSYATPVHVTLSGVPQWVVVSQEEVLGLAAEDGQRLWAYQLPQPGLTNVPTPLPTGDSKIMISGQGIQGTTCLRVAGNRDVWEVQEQWNLPRFEFFYANWMRLSRKVMFGSNGSFLAAIDTDSGKTLGRWRGFPDANVASSMEKIVILDGRGSLSFGEIADDYFGLRITHKFQILEERCWTPVTQIGNRIWVRGGDQLVCLQMGGDRRLENLLTAPRELVFRDDSPEPPGRDAVEKIFAAFETQGKDAALAVYNRLRRDGALSVEAYLMLVAGAQEQKLDDVAAMLISNAAKDFPDSKEILSARKAILGK